MQQPRAVDAYDLSPTQEGMLFHALQGEATGVDLEQIVCSMRGAFDADLFVEAFHQISRRHPILRCTPSTSRSRRPNRRAFCASATCPEGPAVGSCIRFRQLPDSSRQPGAIVLRRRLQGSR